MVCASQDKNRPTPGRTDNVANSLVFVIKPSISDRHTPCLDCVFPNAMCHLPGCNAGLPLIDLRIKMCRSPDKTSTSQTLINSAEGPLCPAVAAISNR